MDRSTRIACFLVAYWRHASAFHTRVVEGSENRNLFLAKQYKLDPEYVNNLSRLDPTGGKFLDWIIRQVREGKIRDQQDDAYVNYVSGVLKEYEKIRNSPKLMALYEATKNINDYSFRDLVGLHDRESRRVKDELEGTTRLNDIQRGSEWVFRGRLSVLKVNTPEAACAISYESPLCTKNPDTASKYLEGGPIYVIFKGKFRLAMYHEKDHQLRDFKNNYITGKLESKIAETLAMAGIPYKMTSERV